MNTPPDETFWLAYNTTLNKSGIPATQCKYYIKWIKQFLRFLNGVEPKDASVQMIDAFLADLKNREYIKEWRVEQARRTFRIL